MALINCPECFKEISDKASSCPNCGCPASEFKLPKKEDCVICPGCGKEVPKLNQYGICKECQNEIDIEIGYNEDDIKKIKCPICGSEQVHVGQRGYSLLLGFIGSGNIRITCLKCGHRWKPKKVNSETMHCSPL